MRGTLLSDAYAVPADAKAFFTFCASGSTWSVPEPCVLDPSVATGEVCELPALA